MITRNVAAALAITCCVVLSAGIVNPAKQMSPRDLAGEVGCAISPTPFTACAYGTTTSCTGVSQSACGSHGWSTQCDGVNSYCNAHGGNAIPDVKSVQTACGGMYSTGTCAWVAGKCEVLDGDSFDCPDTKGVPTAC